MDKAARNNLRNMVTQCRPLLEGAVRDLLEGHFGIHPDGRIEDPLRMSHLSPDDRQLREEVVASLQHIQATMVAGGAVSKDAVLQLVREVGFTHLNRLCAYKILEQRKLMREAVGRGLNSNGFKFYLADHADEQRLWTSGQQEVAYRHFLLWLAGTLSEEVGTLFSSHDPANRLFPPYHVLEPVLALINGAELHEVWDEDEAIGWVYQYFTPRELRDKSRKESQAPRNSYELAFRNQFYTPQYVVRFLVDNSLGRTWYEMRQGNTALKEVCNYLVYRADELFLTKGQNKPRAMNESQAPLLVNFRAKKDPRQIRVLDPACGSGHFLVYCMDLLDVIYAEAYEDPDLGPELKRDYPDGERFKREVPALILRHNLHGIDIDLRATQIASLALWLRARRTFKDLGLGNDERPKIRRANIVCAEPMPGEIDLLDEFVQDLRPAVLGQLARRVFTKMKLASEAGSLLKVEQAIQADIQEARKQWKASSKEEQLLLWQEERRPKPEQLNLFDVAGITDEGFWDEAEAGLLDALRTYAASASNGRAYARGLFAEDAAQGFGFIDLSRRAYDVVLMNPPFGEASKPSRAYVDEHYPRTKNDVFAAFVERGLGWLHPHGILGAITSRTGFFLTSFQKWREEILLAEARPTVVADLGYGVLDTAMVETAAYCLEREVA
jgi:hypothetical protein